MPHRTDYCNNQHLPYLTFPDLDKRIGSTNQPGNNRHTGVFNIPFTLLRPAREKSGKISLPSLGRRDSPEILLDFSHNPIILKKMVAACTGNCDSGHFDDFIFSIIFKLLTAAAPLP